jgi:hypothetical protein
MASRSLTEVFILMRNNAMQSRHIYSEQVSIKHVFPRYFIYIYIYIYSVISLCFQYRR